MGKHGKYIKHYRDEWEKIPIFKNWLTRASEDFVNAGKGEAFCKLCRTPLRAHKTDLEKHAKSKTHTQRENALNVKVQPKLSSFGYVAESTSVEKSNDLRIAVHIACHGSVRSIDHLGVLMKSLGKGSALENIQLHRTKCSCIIKNILEPSLRQELIMEIGNQPYSIILDESTDVATEKYMAYMVRYYNKKKRSITVDFLGFQSVYRATAVELCSAFKEFIHEVGLDINHLIAIGTDGANNLCGKRNSLYTHLKSEIPHLQILKCVCHSLSLCAAKACEELPSSLEYLLRETRNWFSHSPLRIKTYQQVYETLNMNKKPPKLVQLAATRWLSFHAAVEANIKQWIPLKTHFNIVCSSGEKCYQARELTAMYNDDIHLLYLLFLGPLLKDITDLNVIFQAESADITKMYNDLRLLLISTARRVFKPTSLNVFHEGNQFEKDIESVKSALSKSSAEFENSVLELVSIDFGQKFQEVARKGTVPSDKLKEVQKRCSLVLIRLCQEIVNRFPDNIQIVQGLQCFKPEITCFTQTTRPNISEMPWALSSPHVNRDNIECQWRAIGSLRVEDVPGVEKEKITPEQFWVCVLDMTDAGGRQKFKDLAEFALRALSLPISNATVERVFSVMNTIKTKLRNKMQLPMLQAITRIRLFLSVRKICCHNFVPTDDMIKLHNSKNLYLKENKGPSTSTASSSSSVNDDDDGGILEEIILLIEDN